MTFSLQTTTNVPNISGDITSYYHLYSYISLASMTNTVMPDSQALTDSDSDTDTAYYLDTLLPIAVVCVVVLLLACCYEGYYERKLREEQDRGEIEDDRVDYTLRQVSRVWRVSLLSFNN